MDFDPQNNQLHFTTPERYIMGIGQDKAFPLHDIDDLLGDALTRREQLIDLSGAEEDLSLIEDLIIELGDLRSYFDDKRAELPVNCDALHYAGRTALSTDPFKLRHAVRRHDYEGYF